MPGPARVPDKPWGDGSQPRSERMIWPRRPLVAVATPEPVVEVLRPLLVRADEFELELMKGLLSWI